MKHISRAITKFCYKHPRFGVRRLMLYVAAASAAAYLLMLMDTTGMLDYYLRFMPGEILRGEVWRIFTWLILPINGQFIFVAISLYFYYFIGSTLESAWGAGKFTIFYLSGVVVSIVTATIMYYALGAAGQPRQGFETAMSLNPAFLNLSMFFAYAVLFPENRLMLFFIIPIKVKWMGIANAAFFLWNIVDYIRNDVWFYAIIPVAALLNFLLIAGLPSIRPRGGGHANVVRLNFKKGASAPRERAGTRTHRHRCTVCGRTDVSDPQLEFRYCTKCEGFQCYCIEHINDHKHI